MAKELEPVCDGGRKKRGAGGLSFSTCVTRFGTKYMSTLLSRKIEYRFRFELLRIPIPPNLTMDM